MKLHKLTCFVVWFFLLTVANASSQVVTFAATETALASVQIKGKSVCIEIKDSGAAKRLQRIDLDTERVPHLVVGDYSFDGTRGFSVWYLDEGMGTSSISRVFIYSRTQHHFVELRPQCGDEFVNLRIDRYKRVLLSTYYEENEAKVCQTYAGRVR